MLLWLCILARAFTELRAAGLPPVTHAHSGICPNDVNPNLWVDAMSTCTRECQSDQVSILRFTARAHLML